MSQHSFFNSYKNPLRFLFPTLMMGLTLSGIFLFSKRPNQDNSPSNCPSHLRLSLAVDPLHLDPAYAGDSASALILRMIHEGLTRLDHQGKPQLALAEKWTLSADRKRYQFSLRSAYWSNGEKITAKDFVLSWQRMVSAQTPAPNAYHLFVIKNALAIKSKALPVEELGVYALDETTLQVDLEYPCAHFLQLLAFDAFYPCYLKKPLTTNFANLIHCGPYTLKKWLLKNELILETNPLYWDYKNLNINQIKFIIINDPQTALHLFEKGELDWQGAPLSPLPSEAIEPLLQSHQLETFQGASTYWIHYNLKHPLLKNLKARRALSLALNRKLLAASLGQRYEPAFRILPSALQSQVPLKNYLHESLSLAQSLWKEALKEEDIKHPFIELIYNQNSFHARVAQSLQSQWRENLGVVVHLKALEWAVFLMHAQKGQFGLARFGWRAQFSDPTTFLDVFEQAEGAYNFSRWSDPLYQKKLALARKNINDKRLEVLGEAEAELLNHLPVMPLFFESYSFIKNPKLKGVIIGPLGRIDFKSAYWEKTTS
jgi:oligopeptide transport system substrate-binding protein